MPASLRTERVLQAREIRRIGFSLTFSYPLRVSTEIRKASAQATESKAERTALLCEVQSEKVSASKIQLNSRADKSQIALVLNYFISTTKQNEASSFFELASAIYGSNFLHFCKRNVNRVYKLR